LKFSKDEHKNKATENENFLATFPSTTVGIEWAITATFYAALHYVQAYFAISGQSFSSHGSRNTAIGKDPIISVIYDDYLNLYNISRDARYEVFNLQLGHLTYAQNALAEVKKVICPLL
jgi:hypothetical protein